MKTIQQNDNPMNYIPVGANRIRPNEFAPIAFITTTFAPNN